MKCLSCDVILSNDEATAKSPTTNEYLDMCNTCLDNLFHAEHPLSTESLYEAIESINEFLRSRQ